MGGCSSGYTVDLGEDVEIKDPRVQYDSVEFTPFGKKASDLQNVFLPRQLWRKRPASYEPGPSVQLKDVVVETETIVSEHKEMSLSDADANQIKSVASSYASYSSAAQEEVVDDSSPEKLNDKNDENDLTLDLNEEKENTELCVELGCTSEGDDSPRPTYTPTGAEKEKDENAASALWQHVNEDINDSLVFKTDSPHSAGPEVLEAPNQNPVIETNLSFVDLGSPENVVGSPKSQRPDSEDKSASEKPDKTVDTDVTASKSDLEADPEQVLPPRKTPEEVLSEAYPDYSQMAQNFTETADYTQLAGSLPDDEVLGESKVHLSDILDGSKLLGGSKVSVDEDLQPEVIGVGEPKKAAPGSKLLSGGRGNRRKSVGGSCSSEFDDDLMEMRAVEIEHRDEVQIEMSLNDVAPPKMTPPPVQATPPPKCEDDLELQFDDPLFAVPSESPQINQNSLFDMLAENEPSTSKSLPTMMQSEEPEPSPDHDIEIVEMPVETPKEVVKMEPVKEPVVQIAGNMAPLLTVDDKMEPSPSPMYSDVSQDFDFIGHSGDEFEDMGFTSLVLPPNKEEEKQQEKQPSVSPHSEDSFVFLGPTAEERLEDASKEYKKLRNKLQKISMGYSSDQLDETVEGFLQTVLTLFTCHEEMGSEDKKDRLLTEAYDELQMTHQSQSEKLDGLSLDENFGDYNRKSNAIEKSMEVINNALHKINEYR